MLTSVNSNNFSNLLGKFCQIIFYKELKKNKNLMLTSLVNDYATFTCALIKKHN